MAKKLVTLFKRFVEHLKEAVEGKGVDHRGDSHLRFWQKFIHFWALAWRGFTQNRCPVRASALAYTTLLALIPMLAVVASVSTSLLKSQGERPIEFLIEKLVVNVAPQLDLVAEGDDEPSQFSVSDFKNPASLIQKLREQRSEISQYIWLRISPEAKDILTRTNAPLELQRDHLANEFNQLLFGESIYADGRFSDVQLSPEALEMVGTELTDSEIIRLNRLLLEGGFPGEIAELSGRSRVVQTITDSIQKINTGGLGVTGMLGLIFVAILLLSTIETTFNDIWGVTHGRTWLARIIQYWATVTLGPLIPILAIALNAGSQIQTVETWLSGLPVISDNTAKFIFFIALKVVPFVVLSVAFALFYQLMPNTRVRWQAALVGGIVGGCLWQLNSLFSVVYISRVEIYTSIYGPLSLVPIFLIGLYFSWLILLFGAQVAYTFQNRLAYFQERQTEAVNEFGREFVALRIMTLLARRFSRGSKPATEIELGQTLAVPTRLVGDVLKPLNSAGLIHEVEGLETGYTVARPLEKLTYQDILAAIRKGDGEDLETNEDADRALLREHLSRIQNAEASVAGKLSLAMLVEEEPCPRDMEAVTAERLKPSAEEPAAGREAVSKIDRDS